MDLPGVMDRLNIMIEPDITPIIIDTEQGLEFNVEDVAMEEEYASDEDISLGDIADKSEYNKNTELASIQLYTRNKQHDTIGNIAIDS